MTINIYVLKLQNGFYYIGKTENVQKRFDQHLSGFGSAFTKRYKPVAVHKVIKNASPFSEDAVVKEYMAKYGIDKVRGGSYSSEVLTDNQIHFLTREIWGAKDLCTRCGRHGHWIKDCYATKTVDGYEIEESDSEDEWEVVEKFNWLSKGVDDCCFRCGRTGHWANSCYATYHINGNYIKN